MVCFIWFRLFRWEISAKRSLADFRHLDGADLEVFEKLVRLEGSGARVLAAGPERRGAAVGLADAEVVEIDGERARGAAGEDDAVFAERSRRSAGETHDAMLPDALAISYAGAGALVAPMLIHASAGLEERAEGLRVVAFERREIAGQCSAWTPRRRAQ